MKLKSIEIKNFRNIAHQKLHFSPETTLIFGNNAEGKTNVIEAIYSFSYSKSFRKSKERDLIKFGEEEAVISAIFEEKTRDCNLKIKISKKDGKSFYYNGTRLEKMKDFFGHFPAVLFVPEYLKIIKNGPSERRSFIDSAICQIKPSYISLLFAYHRLCEEKNALIKNFSFDHQDKILFEVYNEKLAKSAAAISFERYEFIKKINLKAKYHFEEMSEKDIIDFEFLPSGLNVIPENFEEYYTMLFKKCFENDLKFQRMSTGAQFDDIEILINSNSARTFASQGQQRSAVVAMKLAEGEIIEEMTKNNPIYLFDDILSELDEKRKNYILKSLSNKQVIITSCQNDRNTGVCAYYAKSGTYEKI